MPPPLFNILEELISSLFSVRKGKCVAANRQTAKQQTRKGTCGYGFWPESWRNVYLYSALAYLQLTHDIHDARSSLHEITKGIKRKAKSNTKYTFVRIYVAVRALRYAFTCGRGETLRHQAATA